MPNETSSAPVEFNESSSSSAFPLRHPYLWAAAPSCALCAFTFALAGAPLPQPLLGATLALSTRAVDTNAIVPASETFVVSPQSAAGYILLRGRMQPPTGTPIVAPAAGQVAQVAVRPGQAVRAGQEIVALSTGTAARNAELAPAEKRQSRAEAAQIAAAQRQQAWQQRVREAHNRLEAAQERVQVAQARVAEVREVVRRLQNGEAVDAAELSAVSSSTHGASRQGAVDHATSREAALRDSRRLQARADEVARQAASKRREAEAADILVKAQQKEWLAAQNAADEIAIAASTTSSTPVADANDKDNDKNKETEHAPQSATDNNRARKRAAQDYANALKVKTDAADARAANLHREADRLARRAATLRSQSNKASHRVASSLHNLHVFDNEDAADSPSTSGSSPAPRIAQKSTPGAARSGEGGGKITVAQAARITQDAIEESRAAIADAERIRREVASYERPVENTREQFDKATRRLDAAQERVWDTAAVAGPNVHPVTAPGDGVVLWVAEVAREVQAGDPLAAVGRADRMEVVLHDTTGAWKNVRPGSTLMALVQNSANDANPTSMPIVAQVLNVQGPRQPNAPAVVRVAIRNPRPDAGDTGASVAADGLAGRTFAPGTPVICSLPRVGASTEIAVPSVAIRREEDGGRYVAVLAPVPDAGMDASAARYRVEWRKVQVGRGDGFQNLILAGLEVGDRIALRPAAMQSFVRAHGAQATLRIVQA